MSSKIYGTDNAVVRLVNDFKQTVTLINKCKNKPTYICTER